MKRPSFLWIVIVILIVALVGYGAFALHRPIPTVKAQAKPLTLPAPTTNKLAWPSYGESAVGAQGYGVLAVNGKDDGVPIASIAKTMLAVMLIDKKPLKVGEQGPSLTMNDNDVNLYKTFLAQNGSVVPVNTGEQISEYQLLQALLLPSGDNIADSLAIWGFGSVDTYMAAANDYAKSLGMDHTHFADASGLSSKTVSNAHDLIILGEKVMDNPVLAQIVGQSDVTLPVAGKELNVDSILGQENIIGIKTGNTDEAGGCFLFATKQTIGGQPVILVGVILGAPDRATALNDTLLFIRNNVSNFQLVPVVKAGQVVGTYTAPWGKTVHAIAGKDINLLATNGEMVKTNVTLNPLTPPIHPETVFGTVQATSGLDQASVPLALDKGLTPPSVWWRLFHP